jgi:hypothetical protein
MYNKGENVFIENWKVADFEPDVFSNNKPEYCEDY